jgi:hypothetical protein
MRTMVLALFVLVGAVMAHPSYGQPRPATPTITPVNFDEGDADESVEAMLTSIFNFARTQQADHPIYASFETFREAFLVRYQFLVASGGALRTTVSRRELRDRFRQPSGRLGVILPHVALPEVRVAPVSRTVALPRASTPPPRVAVPTEGASESARLQGRIAGLEERLSRLSGVPRVAPQAIDELKTMLRELAVRVGAVESATATRELSRLVDELSVQIHVVDGRYESLEARVTALIEDTARYVGIGFWLSLGGAGAIVLLGFALLTGGLRVRTLGKRVERIEAQLPDKDSSIRALGERIEQLEVRMGREGASVPSTRREGVPA